MGSRFKIELRPESIYHGLGVGVNPRDEILARSPQGLQTHMAVATRDLLTHPVQESLDRIEVRAVAGQEPSLS